MLRALVERGIVPDLVLGTSVGAINGVAVARIRRGRRRELTEAWCDTDRSKVFDGSVMRRLATLARTRTHLTEASLRAMLTRAAPRPAHRGVVGALS